MSITSGSSGTGSRHRELFGRCQHRHVLGERRVNGSRPLIAATQNAGTQSYAITASAGTGGTISPTGSTSVTSESSQTYSITANSGYTIGSVTVDGASVGAVSTYTFSNVTANHTISATFNVQTCMPSPPSAGTGGTISPDGQYERHLRIEPDL